MKKNITILGTIVLTLCLIFVGYNYISTRDNLEVKPVALPLNGDGDSVEDATLKLESGIEVPETYNVLKYKKNYITKNDIVKIAQKFNMDTSNIEENTSLNQYVAKDSKKRISMDISTGRWQYDDLSQLYISNANVNIPNDDETLKIAENILKQLDFELSDFDKGIVTNVTQQNSVNSKEDITSKAVYFYKKINGENILGVSRLIVVIGDKGEVQSVKKLFNEIDETKSYKLKLRSINSTLKDIKNNNAIIHYRSNAKNIDITSVDLKYWEDSENDVLQPVYIIRGNSADKNKDGFEGYVPAIEEGQTIK